jgi:hypothetical protein
VLLAVCGDLLLGELGVPFLGGGLGRDARGSGSLDGAVGNIVRVGGRLFGLLRGALLGGLLGGGVGFALGDGGGEEIVRDVLGGLALLPRGGVVRVFDRGDRLRGVASPRRVPP